MQYGGVIGNAFQCGCNDLQLNQVMAGLGRFHSFQLIFKAQLVKTMLKNQLAPGFNCVGNPLKNVGQLLDSLVFRVVIRGIGMTN